MTAKTNERYWVGQAKPLKYKEIDRMSRIHVRHMMSGEDAASLRKDAVVILSKLDACGVPWHRGSWCMTAKTIKRIARMKNQLGQLEFPYMKEKSPALFGLPVSVTNEVEDNELMLTISVRT